MDWCMYVLRKEMKNCVAVGQEYNVSFEVLFFFTCQGYILCLIFVKIYLSFIHLVSHTSGFDWQ